MIERRRVTNKPRINAVEITNKNRPTLDSAVKKVLKSFCISEDQYDKLYSPASPGKKNEINKPNEVEVTSFIENTDLVVTYGKQNSNVIIIAI